MRAEQLTRALALVVLALAARVASAEPYLMVRAGAKCSDCHVNKTGGGMRTAFAYLHAHDILDDLRILPIPKGAQTWNGEVNQWFGVGGDLRVRDQMIFQDKPGRDGRVASNQAFRSDLTSNDLKVQQFTTYARVDLIPDMVTMYGDFNMNGGFTDREAVGMIQNFMPWDVYLKAGRLYPSYGLRVWDDEAFIRSQTGYTFATPEEGAEIGMGPGPFFLATTVTNGRPNDKDVAVTVNGYGLWEDVPVVRNVLAGASFARQSSKRDLAAWYAGTNVWDFSALAEFDLFNDHTVGSEPARDQYASYFELHWLTFGWLDFRGTFEFLKVSRNQDRTRYTVGVDPFIDKFIQPRIEYRINNGPTNNVNFNQDELVFELHFWF
jgi:hypothetical protein